MERNSNFLTVVIYIGLLKAVINYLKYFLSLLLLSPLSSSSFSHSFSFSLSLSSPLLSSHSFSLSLSSPLLFSPHSLSLSFTVPPINKYICGEEISLVKVNHSNSKNNNKTSVKKFFNFVQSIYFFFSATTNL